MGKETEQRQSGVWTAYFETGLPDDAKEIYYDAVNKLAADIDETRYRRATYNQGEGFRYPCLVAAEMLKQYTDIILNSNNSVFAFALQWFSFSSRLREQSGQATLRIQSRKYPSFLIMDIAAHLYNQYNESPVFGFSNIPIVVASTPKTAGDILADIYTRTLGETVSMTPAGRLSWFE